MQSLHHAGFGLTALSTVFSTVLTINTTTWFAAASVMRVHRDGTVRCGLLPSFEGGLQAMTRLAQELDLRQFKRHDFCRSCVQSIGNLPRLCVLVDVIEVKWTIYIATAHATMTECIHQRIAALVIAPEHVLAHVRVVDCPR